MIDLPADTTKDTNGTAQLSNLALIVRGFLLVIFAYVAYIWVASLLSTTIALKVLGTLELFGFFFEIILPCLFYFVIGGVAGYLFWPRGYWAVAVWLVCYYPVQSGFHLFWRWSYLLIACAALAGYALQRMLFQKYENQRNFRAAIVSFVVVACVVFAAERFIANARFYTSEVYAKATTIDLPFYENANGIRLKRDNYRGHSFLTFTSEVDKAREIFDFYDQVLTRNGYIRHGEPTFDDSKGINIFPYGGGKAKPFKTKLFAQWTDQPTGVLVFAHGLVESDPEGIDREEEVLRITISATSPQDRLYWMIPF